MYVTHAKNAEELRAEVISDLNHRIERLKLQHKNANSVREQSKLALAMNEFCLMLDFWTKVQIGNKPMNRPVK